MPFSKKLDFLMKIQGVSNSSLAQALSVDPSLVSRWRTGSRKPAKNNNYIRNISEYLATQARTDSQKSDLFKILGLKYNPNKDKLFSISDLIYTWLSGKKFSEKQLVEGFFKKLDSQEINSSLSQLNKPELEPIGKKSGPEVFYGIEGKREGVIKFLAAIAAENQPCTLLLYSDENMDWLTANRKFNNIWSSYLKEILAQGHQIKIIHTVNRELSEKIAAIEHWLPLYMTGAIEPYYYPKFQEYIFKRSLFIAPGIAALTSNTLAGHAYKAEQFLYTDQKIIDNLTQEFNTFLSMCRPLMRIFTGTNTSNFHQLQLEFEEQPGNYITLSDMLSSVTIPETLLKKLLKKNNTRPKLKEKILALRQERFQAFIAHVKNNKYTEIINLASLRDVSDNNYNLQPHDFFYDLPYGENREDYSKHLEYVIKLLKKYENYNLFVTRNTPSSNFYFASKDEVGTIVAKKKAASPIIFAFNQKDMTDAFYIYLQEIIKEIQEKQKNKEFIINMLSNLF